jgi:hypothetical protein
MYSEDAEQAVISAAFAEARSLRLVRALLQADDFFDARNARIFAAQLELLDRGSPIDPIILANELDARGELDAAGGKDYIGFLVDAAPTAANAEYHAGIIVERAQRRALSTYLVDALKLVESGREKPADVAARVASAIASVRPTRERFRLIDDLAMEALPPVAQLVDGMLPASSLAAIYGAPKAGKSFAAVHLAGCVATGEPWFANRICKPGHVVYIAAEGTAGLPQRVAAWKQHHGYDGRRIGIHFLPETANFFEGQDRAAVASLIGRTLGDPPALIIVDTLARSMPGGEENSARDVGLVIDNCDQLRRVTGAAVLLVHHSRKESDIERGSGALRGAVDTLLQVKLDGDQRTLTCEKQKDGPEFKPIAFRLVPTLGSCVIALGEGRDSNGRITITPQQRQALTILSTHFLDDGASATQWMKASGLADASFYRVRSDLVGDGYVARVGDGKGARYVLTDSGRAAIAINSQVTLRSLSAENQLSLSSSHTPLGVRASDSDGESDHGE